MKIKAKVAGVEVKQEPVNGIPYPVLSIRLYQFKHPDNSKTRDLYALKDHEVEVDIKDLEPVEAPEKPKKKKKGGK